jgi:hypothetical protein
MYNKAIYAILAAVFPMTLITASIPTPAFSQVENGQNKTLRIGYFSQIRNLQRLSWQHARYSTQELLA